MGQLNELVLSLESVQKTTQHRIQSQGTAFCGSTAIETNLTKSIQKSCSTVEDHVDELRNDVKTELTRLRMAIRAASGDDVVSKEGLRPMTAGQSGNRRR